MLKILNIRTGNGLQKAGLGAYALYFIITLKFTQLKVVFFFIQYLIKLIFILMYFLNQTYPKYNDKKLTNKESPHSITFLFFLSY